MERKCGNFYCDCDYCLDDCQTPWQWRRRTERVGGHPPSCLRYYSQASSISNPIPPSIPPIPPPPPPRPTPYAHFNKHQGSVHLYDAGKETLPKTLNPPGNEDTSLHQHLHYQNHLLRQQQRQIRDLQSKMVIPVAPNDVATTYGSPFVNASTTVSGTDAQHIPAMASGSWEDNRNSRYGRRPKRKSKRCGNRNNNNDNGLRYSESESSSGHSDDERPLLVRVDKTAASGKNKNRRTEKRNDGRDDATNHEANSETNVNELPGPMSLFQMLYGAFCSLVALLICAVIIIVIFYPIYYLVTHTMKHHDV